MTVFRRWLIRHTFRGIIRQGPWLEHDMAEAFTEIRKVWADEFTEDNRVTRRHHIAEIFKRSELLE